MNRFAKVFLLILVLLPSVFFLSRAFADTEMEIADQTLTVTGPGSFELKRENLEGVDYVLRRPETAGTGGFSLGLIKKGDFVLKDGSEKIRLIENREKGFIHLQTTGKDVYFNFADSIKTQKAYVEIVQWSQL